jgi:hypothetical protein
MIELEVERNQFDRIGLKALHASSFISGFRHGEALSLQTLPQNEADFRFVIDDKYMSGAGQNAGILNPKPTLYVDG